MEFDPRSWARAPARGAQVTANIDALLAENESLRREERLLRQQAPGSVFRGDVSAERGRPGVMRLPVIPAGVSFVSDDLLERIAALEQAARPAPAEESIDPEWAASFAELGLC